MKLSWLSVWRDQRARIFQFLRIALSVMRCAAKAVDQAAAIYRMMPLGVLWMRQ
jgi:hypothetical protein